MKDTEVKAPIRKLDNIQEGWIMSAKNCADENTSVFTNRGTSGTVPLNKYGRPGTFGLAVAEKLATAGFTEAEYIQFVQKMGKKKCIPLKGYIRYFTKEGFNIVFENGRYVQK